ncbi:ribosomal protein 63, mitochondrial [Scaptodrosophila lebanonensis]|uniref:Ribosomal protein 63, mitochondrial n=1 Tax=Drosophila lebanonensis TaxID=7225 RepID=A0A6J2UGS6_DROLE|nr:ribosomal protein 63, mitochondrial [Scaptodrosophila lebanonensis]
MHLTLINFFKKTVPGHIFRGMRRLIKPVSKNAMESLKREYERQDQIMLLLRHPYLTVEESSGHAKELQKREKMVAKWTEAQTLSKLKPHVTIEERLNHLKVKETWD